MRFQRFFTAASFLAVTALAIGCGDSDLGETEVPQLTLDHDSNSIALSLASALDRPASQTAVRFQNTGEEDMEVTSLEWVAQPTRHIGAGSYTGTSCEYAIDAGDTYDSSGECAADTFCWALTSECRERGLPTTPFTLPTGQTQNLDIVLLPGEGEFECPEPPSGRDVPANYCGELLIETTAINDGPNVEDGNARIFFTFAAGSGRISVSPSSINFDGVSPGDSDSRDFTIRNDSDEEALTVQEVRMQDHRDVLSIDGPTGATEIAPGSEQDWTIELNADEDWDGSTIGTNIEITSSGTNERTTSVPVTVSSQQERPAIKLDPQVLRFDEDSSQTLTISNEGSKSLTLQSFSASDAYSFSIEGESFDSQVPSNHSVIEVADSESDDSEEEDHSKEITIEYDASNDDGSGVETLEISYVYYVNGDQPVPETAEVTLLGEVGDGALGLVTPETFLLLAYDGNTQQRHFVVRNVGTQPLDITDASLSDAGDFSLVPDFDPTDTSIAPGDIQEVVVEYSGSDDQMDDVILTLESNTIGEEMTVQLAAHPGTAGGDTEAVITPGFADDTIEVDTEARLSARQSTVEETSMLDSATWVLLDRPDASEAFLDKSGADVSFFPDVAGQYKVSLLVDDMSGASSQVTYPFTAE